MTINTLFDGIVIFVEVVKQGSFAATAQALGHSNSHISKEINKLEARLGVRLLHRTTRSISTTPEGDAYFNECLQLINDAEQAVDLITQHQQSPKGTLKISCAIGFCHHYLTPIISEYCQLYPNVNLDLELTDKSVDVIADGYDLVIRATTNLNDSYLICKKIYTSYIYTVASKEYLLKHGTPHHPHQLTQHDCLTYSNLKHPDKWQFIDQQQQTFTVNVREKMRCNNANMHLSMVQAGHGICRLPGFYLDELLKHNRVETLFMQLPMQQVDVFALYPSRKHLSAKVRRFIDLVSNRLQSN